MTTRASLLIALAIASHLLSPTSKAADPVHDDVPRFTRHVTAVFSRLGCNGGTCHGSVQGKNGFRLSLFSANPTEDYEHLVRGSRGRRIMVAAPTTSLLLRKPLGTMPHGGGAVLAPDTLEYSILHRWIAAGAPPDSAEDSAIAELKVTPAAHTVPPGSSYPLQIVAMFADGSSEDVTRLCSFESQNQYIASVDQAGMVTTHRVGDTALIVRYRAEPVMSMVVVPRHSEELFPRFAPHNFIDEHILAKLQRLNLPPSDVCDDATFLRRASLDLTGRLPNAEEVRSFLADTAPNKREQVIERLLASDEHVALWTLKFCDLLKATDFGVYADAIDAKVDALRFQAWVRARIAENMPYDEFAARILTATSREGRDLKAWQREVTELFAGYDADRTDLEVYARRATPDLYWQRQNATGVAGALQVAHAFLGLRLECAQCHRHPHDVWRQDDLLSFANFFVRLRGAGFQGDHEKQFPEVAEAYEDLKVQGKKLEEEAKSLSEEAKRLRDEANKLKQQADHVRGEIETLRTRGKQASLQGENDEEATINQQLAAKQQEWEALEAERSRKQGRVNEIAELDRRGKYLVEVGRRMMHAEIMHYGAAAADKFASVTSPLGTQSSREFRLLGESHPLNLPVDEDPRNRVAEWLRRPDNPYFARAIVNRVWAHYFGRGIVDPPDDLSPLNPPSHPELLNELVEKFIASGFDLRWLHRQIAASRTYQQSSVPTNINQFDRENYAYFYLRRLNAEVILAALDDATGSREDFGMQYWKWPEGMSAIEIPYPPEQNEFVGFMLEQFGRPERNSAIQCDCERSADASILQVLSLANHPRVWEKIADPGGKAATIVQQFSEPHDQINEIFLTTVGRPPSGQELAACRQHLEAASSAEHGLQSILWSLLNSREFLLQH